MSSYRCPICGANHKEPVNNCRLCGQNMSGTMIPTSRVQVATPVAQKGGIKGLVLIGIGVVLAILVVAVALGLVRSNSAIEKAREVVAPNNVDGWTTQTDDEGKYSVQLPGDRTKETVTFTAVDGGKINVWSAKVGNDIRLIAGYGTVTPPPPGQGPNGSAVDQWPTRMLFLKSVADQWVTENGFTTKTVTTNEANVAGYPAYVVRSTTPRLKLNGQDAFGQAAFVLKGSTLYVLQVTSIYEDSPQLDRMMASFSV